MTDLNERLGQGYNLPDDLGIIRAMLRQPRLAGGAIVTQHGTLASEDFKTGTSGWSIDGNGNVEFNQGVFRGTLTSNDIVAKTFTTVDGPSGQHLQIASPSYDTIEFFTGDTAEVAPGLLKSGITGTGPTRRSFTNIRPPQTTELTVDVAVVQVEGPTQDASIPASVLLFAGNDHRIDVLDREAGTSADVAVWLRSGVGNILIDAPNAFIDLYAPSVQRNNNLWDESSWHGVTFQNSWVNYGSTYQNARYKMTGGQVELQGLVAAGTVSATSTGDIFTLPSGYRPAADLIFAVDCNGVAGRCDVLSSGEVRAVRGNNTYLSLSGMAFTPG